MSVLMSAKHIFNSSFLYLFAIAWMLAGFMTLGWGDDVAAATVREDAYFETAGALGFFIAAFFFFLAFWRLRRALTGRFSARWAKPLVFLGLALLFFFGGGEEISWGQRMLDIETPPTLKAINEQGEINIHNLSIKGIGIPFETLFDLFWGSFAFALPLAARFFPALRAAVGRFLPVGHWGISLLFLFNYLWAKAAKQIYAAVYAYDRVPLRQAVQEIKESHYALLFALLAVFFYTQTYDDSLPND